MSQRRWGHSPVPPCDKPLRSGGEVDRIDPGVQLISDSTIISEHRDHYDADTSRDDHVLERHHAVVVRAETMQRFRGLDVILQHLRNFLLLDCGGYGHRSHGLVKPATSLVQTYFEYIRAMNLWMQISRAVLVHDVKKNQLGRKNLAVRFDRDQARWLSHHRPQERWAAEAL
jgi:hypothetical protein